MRFKEPPDYNVVPPARAGTRKPNRELSKDPGTAFARYALSGITSPLNWGWQGGQALGFWYFGSPLHPTIGAAFKLEFVTGTAILSAAALLIDPNDYWGEEYAIFGFHGIAQSSLPGALLAAEIDRPNDVFQIYRSGSTMVV
jgi:hypothetical protein